MATLPRTSLTLVVATASAAFLVFGGEPGPTAGLPHLSKDLSLALETTMPTIPAFGTLFNNALRWITTPRRRAASLRDLDERTLADIGVHPSEIGSIEAEWAGHSTLTRRRIVAGLQHA